MVAVPKLTTIAACRVAGINRDRFNEHVANGHFPCAPDTIPGRARLFDPDDMLALRLFTELMSGGLNAANAGAIACGIAGAARRNPEAGAISRVTLTNGASYYRPAAEVPAPADLWTSSGSVIRSVTTYNVAWLRAVIAEDTEEERSIIGPDD